MKNSMRAVALAIIFSIGTTSLIAPAQAALIGTEKAMQSQLTDRSHLKEFFDRADVIKALEEQGVDPLQAKARVDALTEEEAQKLAAHIDNAPAGAGIAGALATIFIVLLVTDILGLTKVFSFTRSVR